MVKRLPDWLALVLALSLAACAAAPTDPAGTVGPAPTSTVPFYQSVTSTPAGPPEPIGTPGPGVLQMDWEIRNPVGVAWSPDGRRIAVASAAGLHIYDANSYEFIRGIELRGWISSADVLWSPDSRYLVFGMASGEVRIVDVESGEIRLSLRGNGRLTTAIAWSQDGRWLAAGHDSEAVRLYDLQSGGPMSYVHIGGNHLAFAPDASWLAGIEFSGAQADLVEFTTDTHLRELVVGPLGEGMAVSPDGERVAVSYRVRRDGIDLFDPDTGEILISREEYSAEDLYWSPDGRLLLATRGEWRFLPSLLLNADLSQAVELPSLRVPAIAAAWSPDSRRIVTIHPDFVQITELAQMPEAAGVLQSVADLPVTPLPPAPEQIALVQPEVPPPPPAAPPGTPESPSAADITPWGGSVPANALMRLGTGRPGGHELSPDGRWLAVGGATGVSLYDANTLELLWVRPIGLTRQLLWSRDGLQLAVGLDQGDVIVLKVETGETLHVLSGHHADVTHLDWSRDGERLISADDKGIALIWELATDDPPAALIRSDLEPQIDVYSGYGLHTESAELSPSGTLYAMSYWVGGGCTSSTSNELTIWDGVTGVNYRIITVDRAVLAFHWLDDERLLLVDGRGVPSIWNARTGEQLWYYDGRPFEPGYFWDEDDVTLNRDRSLLAINEDGGTAVLDIASGSVLYTVKGYYGRWSRDGSRLLTEDDGKTLVYDSATAELIAPVEGVGLGAELSPDGSRVYARTGIEGEMLMVWEVATGNWRVVRNSTPSFNGVALSPDGSLAAASTSSWDDRAYEVLIWDTQSGTPLRTLNLEYNNNGGSYNQVKLTWSPDGSLLATAAEEVQIWDTATWERIAVQRRIGFSLAWAPDSSRLAVGSNGSVLLIDPRSGSILLEYRDHGVETSYSSDILGLDWSADGQWIASGGVGSIARVWNAETGVTRLVFDLHQQEMNWVNTVSALALSPDAQWLAVGIGNDWAYSYDAATDNYFVSLGPDLYLVDIATGGVIARQGSEYSDMTALEWSPDGTLIAGSFGQSGYLYGMGWSFPGPSSIILWDGATGEFLYSLPGHDSGVQGLAFSQDGTRLASASLDGTVLIWRMQ